MTSDDTQKEAAAQLAETPSADLNPGADSDSSIAPIAPANPLICIDSPLSVTYKLLNALRMLGDTVRETRIRKGLTQARLARMAGVSRRHLAALEKGANVSVLVLRKVAAVLDLHEIELGEGMSVVTGSRDGTNVNLPLLADTIREAHAGAVRAEAMLARASGLLAVGGIALPEPAHVSAEPNYSVSSHFPATPLFQSGLREVSSLVRDGDWIEVELWGEMRQGEPVDESVRGEHVLVPAGLYAKNERVFRARGDGFMPLAISDGDLLITELRTRGKAATAELAVVRIDDAVWIGRLWQKNGHRTLMTDVLVELPLGKKKEAMKVVAVVNQVVRPSKGEATVDDK